MTYEVVPTNDVAAQASSFEEDTFRYWNVCLAEIASNPFPRFGLYVDRLVPIRGFPMRTYLYEISEETSVSGERLFALVAEFFPEHAILYVVNEAANRADIIYLRPSRW